MGFNQINFFQNGMARVDNIMPKIKLDDAAMFFDVYGSKLSINEAGVKEKPTLLVLHGGHGMVDHTLFVDFWSRFSDVAQIIFLDQRGCGRSDRRESSEWNLKQWGQDVFDFCDALGIEKPIVAGIAIGGHVLCDYVTRYPEHPSAVIFCNTEAKTELGAMLEKFRELGGDEVAEICRQNYLSPTPETVAAYKEKCVPLYAKKSYSKNEMARCIPRMEVIEHYCNNEINHFNYLDLIHKIQCPTLFMVGEKSPGHPPALARKMADKIDSRWLSYHEFKNAGAPVYKDLPLESEHAVRTFIQSLI